ncbi:MAG: class I SAM-dependent methyltransferase [Synechococcales bacterium]|nr:class I SAM-dependent methyltransferase [Synechococcales bacterium]
MVKTPENMLDNYWQEGFSQVEGWLSPNLLQPLKVIAQFHKAHGIQGNVLEIGVHHGKFLIPLALMTQPGEIAIGIDIFEDQQKNIDFSGLGSYGKTAENIKRYCDLSIPVKLVRKDSLAMTVKDRLDLLSESGAFRLVSIDGGHTCEHTVNDLLIAQDILQSGGVVILDDYYNMHWPGVHEGVARFFMNYVPKLKIFSYTQNKLFLSDFTHHRRYYQLFQENFNREANYKLITMWGSEVVCY